MRSVTTSVLGMNLSVSNCPETAEEYDAASKAIGACVDTAVDNDLQHSWKGRFRKALLSAVSKATGNARYSDEDGKFTETEKIYWARVQREADDKSVFQPIVDQVLAATPYEATGSTGRIGKAWLDQAETFLETVAGSDWARFVANISDKNAGFSFEFGEDGTTPTRESIALALKVDDARVSAETRASHFG